MVIASEDARGGAHVAGDRQATAAPPGLGPVLAADDDARGLICRTRPQLVHVSLRPAGPGRTSGRSREASPPLVAPDRAGRIDEGMRPAVGQTLREDRLPVRPDGGQLRSLSTTTFTRGLRTW